jgi:ArsR family transcriptional regulator, cadmium/lead-responsive transcriptional repressor
MKCNYYYIFFGNLANPIKIRIIEELKKRPLTVSELSKKTGEEQSKISHALANLKECSIVTFEKNGKNRLYSLNKKTILPILKILDKHKTKHCKGACIRVNRK